MYIYIYMRVCVYIYASMRVHIHTSQNPHMLYSIYYILYIHIYIHTYIYIYIYTYIYTRIPKPTYAVLYILHTLSNVLYTPRHIQKHTTIYSKNKNTLLCTIYSVLYTKTHYYVLYTPRHIQKHTIQQYRKTGSKPTTNLTPKRTAAKPAENFFFRQRIFFLVKRQSQRQT